jgi:hypothetical protein
MERAATRRTRLGRTADLVSQALNLRLTFLSKEFSQKLGGTAIGGYAKTALTNNQGELVIPAYVKVAIGLHSTSWCRL